MELMAIGNPTIMGHHGHALEWGKPLWEISVRYNRQHQHAYSALTEDYGLLSAILLSNVFIQNGFFTLIYVPLLVLVAMQNSVLMQLGNGGVFCLKMNLFGFNYFRYNHNIIMFSCHVSSHVNCDQVDVCFMTNVAVHISPFIAIFVYIYTRYTYYIVVRTRVYNKKLQYVTYCTCNCSVFYIQFTDTCHSFYFDHCAFHKSVSYCTSAYKSVYNTAIYAE